MTGSVDEGDSATVAGNGVCAYVLGDTAGLALGYAALTESVKQGGLAVVNVAHYGNNGRTADQVLLGVGFLNALVENILGSLGYIQLQLDAVICGDKGAGIIIYLLINGCHYAQDKQLFDYLGGGFADLF